MQKTTKHPRPLFCWLLKPRLKKSFQKLLFLSLILSSSGAFAQDPVTVSGTITDENGVPMPYVTVGIKNSNAGAVSDASGNYEVSATTDAVLVFSYVGYQSQEVAVEGRSTIDVQLQPDMDALEEVVVVGYGTQKKSDLTGAIASISADEIDNFAVPNTSQLLQGKAAGVHVSSSSGQPGSSAVIRIRGYGTVNDNNPLFVVDGQFFDNINNLNPNDIESIEILKDASSTSIYGSRGSNGVILVTTKKGVIGRTVTSFDTYVGWKDSYDPPAMMNSDQFHDFILTAHENAGQTLNPNITEQYNRGFDTDWWEEVNRRALTQNHNFSISKGGENYRSYFSLGYLDDEGPIITTDFSRVSLKLNNEYDVTSRFTVGANLGVAKIESTDANSLPRFDFILQADPFTPVINPLVEPGTPNYEYNKYAPTEYSFNPNPVAYLNINDRESKEFNFYGNLFANLELLQDLTYSVQFNYEHNSTNFKLFRPAYQSTFSEFNTSNMESKYRNISDISHSTGFATSYLIEQRLSYNKTLGEHGFDIMVANTFEENESEGISAYKLNTPGNSEAFRVLSAATDGDRVSGGKSRSSILSYLGRLNYSYSDRYLATVNFRADGSSRFANGNKWGYFPSFSLGWRLTNETFFQNLDIENVLSDLKIRAGWGRTGNQRIDSNAPLTLIGTGPDRQWYFGTDYSQGFLPTNMGNPDIKWETSEQTNIGFDAGLLHNRLTLNFNYFIKKTDDMLLRVPIPSIAGYPNYPYSNAGNVENKGYELAFDYRDAISDFNYSFGGNLSHYSNEVTSLGNGGLPLFGSVSRTEVGGPMSRFYGYVWEGIFQNTGEVANYVGPEGNPVQPNATPGDFKFADLNNDGIINDSDRTYIGNPHPDLIYGFNLNIEYKGFDFSSSFQGTIGNDIYNGLKTMGIPGLQNGLAAAYTDAWFQEGDNASYPKPSLTNSNNNYRGSSWWVEDGSFLRLQNVQLGYTLGDDVLSDTFMNSLRLYVSGQNLLTFTDYSGADPEIGTYSALDIGYDNIRYPSSRTVLIGLNVQF